MTTEWEILVVDNNSTDNTRQTVERFCTTSPGRFRYLFEPNQGKSNALNTAVREARGRILAFTDDDVTVEPQWLHNLTSVLDAGDYAGSAGRILPASILKPPPWLALEGQYNLIGALCPWFDLGATPHELREPPFGANMPFRREMFAKYGAFRVDLGPCSKARVSSEDLEFGRRLLAGGERLYYVPSATVYHEILEERVNKEFFLTWWSGLGTGSVRENETNLTVVQFMKIFGRALITALEGLTSLDPKRRFYCKCRVWYGAGKLSEAFRRASRQRIKMGKQALGSRS